MSFLRFCKHTYLTRFSQPEEDRALYLAIKKNKSVRSIVEIGISDLSRTKRMLQIASELAGAEKIQYTGIDMFEGRDSDDGVALKEAHRQLKQAARQIKLLPGDPFSALARSANALQDTDLLIVSADVDRDSLDRAWFYVPRMLHKGTLMFIEVADDQGVNLELLNHADVEAMCQSQDTNMRRAG